MKILYNKQYGGFGISVFAALKLIERKNLSIYVYIPDTNENGEKIYKKMTLDNCSGNEISTLGVFLKHDHGDTFPARKILSDSSDQLTWKENPFVDPNKLRFDPVLIQLFEEYGSGRISGDCATLALTKIEKGRFFTIHEYDGYERVEEYYIDDSVFYADH